MPRVVPAVPLALVAALTLALVADASAAKRPNYASAATKAATGLSKAKSDGAARRELVAIFRGLNVTVLGAKGKRRQVLVRGFSRSPRDLFMTDPQIAALAGLARADTSASMSKFAYGLTQLAGSPVSADQAARAVRDWIAAARKQAKKKPSDRSVFLPVVVDRLAKLRGVDLAKADATTALGGIETYLLEIGLAPAKPAKPSKGRVLPGIRSALSCSELNSGSGFGSWLARSFARALVAVIDRVLPTGITTRGLAQAAVALGTDVTPTADSEPRAGRPIHWQHFDEPVPTVARFKLEFVNRLPVPQALSDCLELAGIDVPPQGGRRSDVPVIWWLDDGTASTPEMTGQTLRMQGRWEHEGPSSALSGIADLVSGLTNGRLLGSSASDSSGVATMRLTPRTEPGPYRGDPDRIKGELLAIPLTAGTDSGVQQIANVFSAVARNVTFKVDIEHHVKVGWRFAQRAVATYTTPCDGEDCPRDWHVELDPVRCAPAPAVESAVDPGFPRADPVGPAGNWTTPPFGSLLTVDGAGRQHNPLFVVPDQVGASQGIGTTQRGTASGPEGSIHMFRREADTRDAAHITLEHWNDHDNDSDTPFQRITQQSVDLVPIARATDLPAAYYCDPFEQLEELP